jgi:hypothetical protein
MKEQIQQLISTGQTEEALQLLVKSAPDAILLQARYNQGKKQYNMGLIEFGEWSRIQAQINYAALELAGSAKTTTISSTPVQNGQSSAVSNGSANTETGKKVFVSYSQKDWDTVEKIKNYLESRGVDVRIDKEDLNASEKIRDFILRNFKDNDFILFVASNNSLRSGWVGFEQTLATFADLLDKLKVLNVRLDDDCFRDDLPLLVAREVREEIAKLDELIEQYKTEGIPFTNVTTKRQRLEKFRLGIADLIDRLQNSLTLDVGPVNFNDSMARVLSAIERG